MNFRNAVLLKFKNRLWFRILVVLILLVIFAISVTTLYTTQEFEKNASLKKFTDYLNERIPALMKDYDIPGVTIALIQKGEIKWSQAYGYADIEKGRKMTTDTYCRVESITKSVTAWGVMKLVEEGKIELDKPVKQYIKNWAFPESQFSEEKVTVRQLLTHTAGMPLGDFLDRYSPKEEMPSLEESLSKKAILIQEPGVSFLYSNTGYNVLELLIEEVTGLDFAEYMEKEVLIPVGMYRSSFNWSEKFDPAVPVGYDLKGNPIPVYVYPEKASGGLFATIEDIAAFVTAGMKDSSYRGHQVLTSQNIDELYTPMVEKIGIYGFVFNSYGMGYYIETLANGKKSVANGGQGGGVMTYFQSVPETGDGIVILTNSQRSWPFFGYILSDWSEWGGFAPVGFGKIILAQKALWILMGLILFIILWQGYRLIQGLISDRRRFAPIWKQSRFLRLVQISVSIVLLVGLLWSINQDYLFISSVFPKASNWLGFLVFLSAVVLLMSALFPYIEDNKKDSLKY
ncbi:MAG: serine hydrolase domain-containing protein [Peptococcales bacterium]